MILWIDIQLDIIYPDWSFKLKNLLGNLLTSIFTPRYFEREGHSWKKILATYPLKYNENKTLCNYYVLL